MPYLKRTDSNQKRITNALKRLGYSVIDCSGVGRIIPGFPDLLVIGNHIPSGMVMMAFAEIKTDKGKLNENQVKFFEKRLERFGTNAPWIEAKSVDDILRWYGAIWEG